MTPLFFLLLLIAALLGFALFIGICLIIDGISDARYVRFQAARRAARAMSVHLSDKGGG